MRLSYKKEIEKTTDENLCFISKRAFKMLRSARKNPDCFKALSAWVLLAIKELEKKQEIGMAESLKELLFIQSRLILVNLN